jgi:hypothetical protein
MRGATVSWLIGILSNEPREVGVEACYFVARELKQLMIPAELRKDPLADAEASLPTSQGRLAGQRIIENIKSREGLAQLELSHERASYYLDLVLEAGKEIAKDGATNQAEGARLLAQLRAAADNQRT